MGILLKELVKEEVVEEVAEASTQPKEMEEVTVLMGLEQVQA